MKLLDITLVVLLLTITITLSVLSLDLQMKYTKEVLNHKVTEAAFECCNEVLPKKWREASSGCFERRAREILRDE